jgi:hypothetical protein
LGSLLPHRRCTASGTAVFYRKIAYFSIKKYAKIPIILAAVSTSLTYSLQGKKSPKGDFWKVLCAKRNKLLAVAEAEPL